MKKRFYGFVVRSLIVAALGTVVVILFWGG